MLELAKPRASLIALNEVDRELDFLEAILSAKLSLIAYDCDFNYEPCNKKGVKAHWALIIGFLLPVDLVNSEQFLPSDSAQRPNEILHFTTQLAVDQIKHLRYNYENKTFANNKAFRDLVYVVCKHGKSKNVGIWNLKKLIESNSQLREINSSKCDRSQFVLPDDGDLTKTISSKVLIFN